jgi:hypothetical protein
MKEYLRGFIGIINANNGLWRGIWKGSTHEKKIKRIIRLKSYTFNRLLIDYEPISIKNNPKHQDFIDYSD